MIINASDIEAVLRRPLTESEISALEHLTNEAQLLIESYTGGDYDQPEVPTAVRTVANRMIARSFNADPALEGVTQVSQTNGPFSQSRTFTAGGNGLFLNKADRQMLSKLRAGFGTIKLANY